MYDRKRSRLNTYQQYGRRRWIHFQCYQNDKANSCHNYYQQERSFLHFGVVYSLIYNLWVLIRSIPNKKFRWLNINRTIVSSAARFDCSPQQSDFPFRVQSFLLTFPDPIWWNNRFISVWYRWAESQGHAKWRRANKHFIEIKPLITNQRFREHLFYLSACQSGEVSE